MMNNQLQQLDPESLSQLPIEVMVKIIIQQAIVNTALLSSIQELKQEIEKLRVIRDLDSKTSSKPPSTDLLVTFQEVRAHLGVETQRQWADLSIARTTPAKLAIVLAGDLGGTPCT